MFFKNGSCIFHFEINKHDQIAESIGYFEREIKNFKTSESLVAEKEETKI